LGRLFIFIPMKKVLIALVCVFFAKAALAQKELLSFDEQNRYIYYQVVNQPGLSVDTLQARALYFLKAAYPKDKIKQGETPADITGTGKFLVLSGITLVKHEDGEILYSYTIECKDQKYRFWLTGFEFTPYKTDRYGNSVPEPGIEIKLEDGLSKLDKKQLDDYLNQTGAFSKEFGDKLKKYMLNISAAPPKEVKKKVITKDW
jgi:hypothetical protein